MTPSQFWQLTPGQYYEMILIYKQEKQREELNAGIIASVIANVNRDSKRQKNPFQPSDFMPSIQAKPKQKQTPEEMFQLWNAIIRPIIKK